MLGLGAIGIFLCIFMGGFFGTIFLLGGIACLVFLVWLIRFTINDYRDKCQKYIEDSQNYEQLKKDYEKQCAKDEEIRTSVYKNLRKFSDEAQNQISSINSDIDSINNQLQEAYNLNIIPLPFRNIQGVYYLYDYISTSSQSLSEALMQCNLEAIKQKLDNVIDLQGKAIVQQAQANKALYEQNQEILETAISTMNNTAVSAQYARIAAINSEVSLKMQSKQLAYQKAEFWLKG